MDYEFVLLLVSIFYSLAMIGTWQYVGRQKNHSAASYFFGPVLILIDVLRAVDWSTFVGYMAIAVVAGLGLFAAASIFVSVQGEELSAELAAVSCLPVGFCLIMFGLILAAGIFQRLNRKK